MHVLRDRHNFQLLFRLHHNLHLRPIPLSGSHSQPRTTAPIDPVLTELSVELPCRTEGNRKLSGFAVIVTPQNSSHIAFNT